MNYLLGLLSGVALSFVTSAVAHTDRCVDLFGKACTILH